MNDDPYLPTQLSLLSDWGLEQYGVLARNCAYRGIRFLKTKDIQEIAIMNIKQEMVYILHDE